jgi:hypothetical protein
MVSRERFLDERMYGLYFSANIYGLSIIMGFSDGVMKVMER